MQSNYEYAGVAELADALDLGSSGRPCRFKSCHPQRQKGYPEGYPFLLPWMNDEKKPNREAAVVYVYSLRDLHFRPV